MYVSDPVSPGINITANLSEEEVDNFKQICKMFIPASLHEKNIDKYLMQTVRDAISSVNDKPLAKNAANRDSKLSMSAFRNATDVNANRLNNSLPKNHSSAEHVGPASSFVTEKCSALAGLIDIGQVSARITAKAIDLISRTMDRISVEIDIVGLLGRHLKAFDSTLEAMPFGSRTYGYGGHCTDVNILINTGTEIG